MSWILQGDLPSLLPTAGSTIYGKAALILMLTAEAWFCTITRTGISNHDLSSDLNGVISNALPSEGSKHALVLCDGAQDALGGKYEAEGEADG